MTEAMDDDEDGCGNIGTNRYQATPSLQALQQMRNRLHTAFLGRRLMKWTALATGKELRKISGLLNTAQEPAYNEEFRKAMMLLARCRFHNPEFQKVLLENVEKNVPAHVKCITNSKHVAGKKVILLEMLTEGPESQPLTCLSRGGEIVQRARKCWYELLQHFLQILELRCTFIVVYKTNREATKKKNVMGKIVIPKTINTIRYILNELEELEREDFFRLKKIKNLKVRRKLEAEPGEARRNIDYYEHERKICSHVCVDKLQIAEDIKQVSDSSNEQTIAVDCQDKDAFVCDTYESKPPSDIKQYMEEVIAISKALDEGSTTKGDMREELYRFFHNFAMMKKALMEGQYTANAVAPVFSKHSKFEIDAICKPVRSRNEQFNVTLKGSKFDTPSVSQIKTTFYDDIPDKDKDDDLVEGYFETEYKEITKVRRSRDEDGKIKEETEIIMVTTRTSLPEEPRTDEVQSKETGTPDQIKAKKSTASNSSTTLNSRAQSSNSVNLSDLSTPTKKLSSKSFVDKLKNVQLSRARKGVVMLPGEVSNLMDEAGGSKDDAEIDINKMPPVNEVSKTDFQRDTNEDDEMI